MYNSKSLRIRSNTPRETILDQCGECGYVIEKPWSTVVSLVEKCLNCGIESELLPFPNEFSAAGELTAMISHFYVRGENLIKDAQKQLVNTVFTHCRVEFDIRDLEEAAAEIDRDGLDYDDASRFLKQKLGVSLSGEDAYIVLDTLRYYRTTPDENIAVLVLTCTLFEVLLADLVYWVTLPTSKGSTQASATTQSTKLKKQFQESTNLTLQEACEANGLSKFWSEHEYLRKIRNQFLHEGSAVIDGECTIRAYKFAESALQAFAKLQNAYGLIMPAG